MLAAILNAVKHGFYRKGGEDAGRAANPRKKNLPEGSSRPVFKKSGRVSGKSKVGWGKKSLYGKMR